MTHWHRSFKTNGVSLAPGTASGYTIQFTNGLSVYLSGDTGLSSDMLLVIRRFYHPDLVIFNIGDIFTTGPEEAAFAINELIEPTTVIPSHAKEIATSSGAVIPGTKTARFMQLVNRADVVPPLSGQVVQFDGSGHCISGCAAFKAPQALALNHRLRCRMMVVEYRSVYSAHGDPGKVFGGALPQLQSIERGHKPGWSCVV